MRSSGFALAVVLTVLAVLGTHAARADIASDCTEWHKTHGAGSVFPTVCLGEMDGLKLPNFAGIGATHRELYLNDLDIQMAFDQGLRLYYAFNFREAYRAFRTAASFADMRKNPCGYCYWGIAASLSVAPGSFLPPEPDRREARNALNKARTIFKPEQTQAWGLTGALLARTGDCTPQVLNCAGKRAVDYYNAVKPLAAANTHDPEIIALYADAVLGLPTGERLADGRKALKTAMDAPFNANHTGLWHWYLLVMEASDLPQEAEAAADKLRTMAPAAGQLQHTPSHIYFLLGSMDKSLAANSDAVSADLSYFEDTRNPLKHPDGDVYRYESYPHELHFLIASALMRGNRATVELAATKFLDAPPKVPGGYRQDFYRTMYYLGRLPLATVKEVEEFPKPLDKQPLASIAYYYAQTRADFWNGKTESANLKLLDAAVAAYPDKQKCPDEYKTFHTEPCLVEILSNLAHAYAAAGTKNWREAMSRGLVAATIQSKMRDGLPGVWVLPANQTIASFYLQAALAEPTPPQDYLKKAQDFLGESLKSRPGNGWAYFGLWQVAKHIKDGKPADAEKAFRAHWTGDVPALNHM